MPADSTSSFINAKSMSPARRALADYVMGLKAGGRKLNVPHVQQPLHHGLGPNIEFHCPSPFSAFRFSTTAAAKKKTQRPADGKRESVTHRLNSWLHMPFLLDLSRVLPHRPEHIACDHAAGQ